MTTLRELIDEAKDELKERLRDGEDADDIVSEIASESVPVYTADSLECAMDDSGLMFTEAADGGDHSTAIDILNAVIYDAIYEALVNAADGIRADLDEEDGDEEEENADVETDDNAAD